MAEEIIIWGAGAYAAKKYEWATLAGYQVICFMDNDSTKWGKEIESTAICSPKLLAGYRCPIIIPDLYAKEIATQLDAIGYPGRRILYSDFQKEAVCRKEATYCLPDSTTGRCLSFVVDTYFTAFNWGGIESWSCMIANYLSSLNVETHLICGANKRFDAYAKHCLHFQEEMEPILIKKMAAAITQMLPCVFLTHGSIALYAAQLVKTKYPDKIQIIAVAHGDEKYTYERLQFWSEHVDKIICISKRIQEKLQNQYKVPKNKLIYRPNPIEVPDLSFEKSRQNGRLKVGFAARLRKEQKRAHLLPELIEACMERQLDIEFSIAGEGECLALLEQYVSDRHLEERVQLLGWIPPTQMASFWQKQDVYLNLSDFEGMSLAMLEAMACGAVPVVTLVSGVDDLIDDGENGFVVPVELWMEAVDKLEMLCKDRKLLQKAGRYNRKLVKAKCDVSDYANWLLSTFCL